MASILYYAVRQCLAQIKQEYVHGQHSLLRCQAVPRTDQAGVRAWPAFSTTLSASASHRSSRSTCMASILYYAVRQCLAQIKQEYVNGQHSLLRCQPVPRTDQAGVRAWPALSTTLSGSASHRSSRSTCMASILYYVVRQCLAQIKQEYVHGQHSLLRCQPVPRTDHAGVLEWPAFSTTLSASASHRSSRST